MAESLFTSQTPAVSGTDGAPGITTGTTVQFLTAGSITHVRYYTTTTTGGTYTCGVWEVLTNDSGGGGTGSLLASKIDPNVPTGSSWNLIELDTPVPVVTGKLYRIGLHNPTRYVATNSFFVTGLTNGNIDAPQDGSDPVGLGAMRQGTFALNPVLSYPITVGASASYFIDVVFVADSSATELAGTITAPAATASGSLDSSSTLAGVLTAPAATAGGSLDPGASLTAALTAPAATAAGVLTTAPALDGVLTAPSATMSGALVVEEAVVSTPNQAGWNGLLGIVREARQMRREDVTATPVACPNDGEPLQRSSKGVLFCPYDGYRPG